MPIFETEYITYRLHFLDEGASLFQFLFIVGLKVSQCIDQDQVILKHRGYRNRAKGINIGSVDVE